MAQEAIEVGECPAGFGLSWSCTSWTTAESLTITNSSGGDGQVHDRKGTCQPTSASEANLKRPSSVVLILAAANHMPLFFFRARGHEC